MSLLTIIQSVCNTTPGLTSPTAVVSSTDPNIVQLLALANEEGRILANRHQWQALQKESTFTTLAAEIQGTIASLAGSGFKYVRNDTMWNRDLRRPVFGPLAPYQWQQLKAQNISGPWNQYRIRGGNLLFIPSPTAGQNIYFEWITKYWATGAGGDAASFVADADTAYLDEDIMTIGVRWRYCKARGLEYAEDKDEYERLIADAIARDGSKPVLNLNGVNAGYPAGIFVPAGGWTGH